jgi:hypothetical protein
MIGEVASPIRVNDLDLSFGQGRFGGEEILNFSRTSHGDHGGVLQEKESVFDLPFSASPGQMVLET